MAYWDIGLRHVVDVDRQPLANEAVVIDTVSLFAKVNRPADRPLWFVRAGERFLRQPKQPIRLSPEEVLFIESCASMEQPAYQQLAA